MFFCKPDGFDATMSRTESPSDVVAFSKIQKVTCGSIHAHQQWPSSS
jgi:hypothetical protein